MPSLQEIHAAMNAGLPSTDAPPEPKIEQPPAQPAEPKVEPVAPAAPATPPGDKNKAAEPPKDNTANPAGAPKPGEPNNPPAEPAAGIPDEKFYGRLSEMTGGSVKSEQDLVGFINDYNALLEQAEKGFEPKFQNERAKVVHQLLNQNLGQEPQAAMRILQAMSFTAEGKSTKDVLFQAYLLDPNNADLGPTEAQKYFEAEYEGKYSDLEGNLVKERQLANELKAAHKLIKDTQESFKGTEEAPFVPDKAVENAVSEAVDKFGGVKLSFTDNPQENDYLTIPVENPAELEQLKQDMLNPQQWWADFLGEFETDRGFDYNACVKEFHEMRNHQRNRKLAYDHGFKLGKLAQLNESRNASDPKNIDSAQPAAIGKPTFEDAWLGARKG